jgi:hypothetical protein
LSAACRRGGGDNQGTWVGHALRRLQRERDGLVSRGDNQGACLERDGAELSAQLRLELGRMRSQLGLIRVRGLEG